MSFLVMLVIGIMIVLTIAAVAAILIVGKIVVRGMQFRINQVIDSYEKMLNSERDFAREMNKTISRINTSINDANARVQKNNNSHV